MNSPAHFEQRGSIGSSSAIAKAAWHSLLWLVVANAIGSLLAVLLLVPSANSFLGEWTYGRWVMVHMNIELYGWTSLPLVGYLFHIYDVDRGPMAKWSRPILWSWSAALAAGAFSWLSGHSTGKLFLDWQGFAQGVFIVALIALWLLLLRSLFVSWIAGGGAKFAANIARFAGLIILLAVPFALLAASNRGHYPPINPATGGPTGSSQLESSLAIVLITLLLPLGIAKKRPERTTIVSLAWIVLIAHAILCAAMGRGDASHHERTQYLGLATILIWLPVVPAYYRAFAWHAGARMWKNAVLAWWAVLLVSGFIMFLPGVLDRFKFTDGLVGHSFVAMAGYTSSLIVLVMVQLLGNDSWILTRKRTFYLWNIAVSGYVIVMMLAGWQEGTDPSFTIVPGGYRNILYVLRLIVGLAMLIASIEWLVDCTSLLRAPGHVVERLALERTV